MGLEVARLEGARDAEHGRAEADDTLARALAWVPGHVSEGELRLLRRLAGESRATVVELGAFHGLATVALCLGAQANATEVVTVDAFIPVHEALGLAPDTPEEVLNQTLTALGVAPAGIDAMRRLSEGTLRENLAAFGFAPRIIHGLAHEAAGQVAGPVGLLFHDADHARGSVLEDLAAWTPTVTADGVIAVHDHGNPLFPDVQPAADEWAAREGWQKAERDGWLQVFRRLSVAHQPAVTHESAVVSAAEAGTSMAAPATMAETTGEGTEATVRAYLQALDAGDLDRCLAFYADDAVLTFLNRPFRGRQAVADWHRERFAAGLRLVRLDGVRQAGDTVQVDVVVASGRLQALKIAALPVRATVRLRAGRIAAIGFGLRTFNPFKGR